VLRTAPTKPISDIMLSKLVGGVYAALRRPLLQLLRAHLRSNSAGPFPGCAEYAVGRKEFGPFDESMLITGGCARRLAGAALCPVSETVPLVVDDGFRMARSTIFMHNFCYA